MSLREQIAKQLLQWHIDNWYGCPQKNSDGNPSTETGWDSEPDHTKQKYRSKANSLLRLVAEWVEGMEGLTDEEINQIYELDFNARGLTSDEIDSVVTWLKPLVRAQLDSIAALLRKGERRGDAAIQVL